MSNKKTPTTDGQIPVYLCGVSVAEFNRTANVLVFSGVILGCEYIAMPMFVNDTSDKESGEGTVGQAPG
jgi:hypothetical protein